MASKPSTVVFKSVWGWAAERLGIQPWGQILIIILLGQATIIFGWLWSIHGDVKEISGKLSSLPVSVSKDLLSQAAEDTAAHNLSRALQATESAQSLIIRSKVKHIPATPDDFQEMIVDLNLLGRNPEVLSTANGTRMVLADYRSSLEPRPKMHGDQAKVEASYAVDAEAASINKSNLPASVLVAPPSATFDFFSTPFLRRLSNAPSVIDVGMISGNQALDGWRWNRDVFVDTVIRYDGGEVELNNTRFINCRFELSDSRRSAKLATYIALQQPYLKIGPGD